ncbi:MAG: FixH family protein [Proteobacteria bacterium]|nr:FixH family protein [Pseudomonadota bacterium]
MRTSQTLPSKPWWKEPWPWILIGLPGSVVVASLITVSIAFTHADSVVTDHYYTKGLEVGVNIDKELHARAMHLQGQVDQTGQELTVELEPAVRDAVISLRLRHPYAPGRDLHLTLQRVALGRYVGRAVTDAVRYTVTAESAQWRLSGVWKPGAAAPLKPGV